MPKGNSGHHRRCRHVAAAWKCKALVFGLLLLLLSIFLLASFRETLTNLVNKDYWKALLAMDDDTDLSMQHRRGDVNNNHTLVVPTVHSSNICQEVSNPWIKFTVDKPYPHALESFLQGKILQEYAKEQADDDNKHSHQLEEEAICQVDNLSGRYNGHWVHFLQEFYSCVSYWQQVASSNGRRRRVPILASISKEPPNSPYIQALLDAVQQVFQVQVEMGFRPSRSRQSVTVHPIGGGFLSAPQRRTDGTKVVDAYQVASPSHVQNLRDGIVRHLSNDSLGNCKTTEFPRIRILNRGGGRHRSLVNVDELVQTLRSVFGPNASSSTTTDDDNMIQVVYFENTTFAKQVLSMASTDILISPHGAQLGSIPFMPRCGSLLEFLPKSYWAPYFYGSLAHVSGLTYRYLYLSNGKPNSETLMTPYRKQHRYAARSVRLCAPLQETVRAVAAMVEEWKACQCPT